MDQRQRLEAQLAQHQAPQMPRGVQSGIQPTEDACSSNGAPAAGPVPAAPAEEDESYEASTPAQADWSVPVKLLNCNFQDSFALLPTTPVWSSAG